jgi:hypothetical protein
MSKREAQLVALADFLIQVKLNNETEKKLYETILNDILTEMGKDNE